MRLIDSCVTQLKAQGPSRTCNESKEEAAQLNRVKMLAGVSRSLTLSPSLSLSLSLPPPLSLQKEFPAMLNHADALVLDTMTIRVSHTSTPNPKGGHVAVHTHFNPKHILQPQTHTHFNPKS